MRRVLLFLALVGIGVAALLLLRQRVPRPEGTAVERAPSPPGQFTQIPLGREEPGGEGGSIQVILQGSVDVTQFQGEGEVRNPIRKLHADDSQALGASVYVLRGMLVTLLDPETGATTAELSSPKTRLRIDLTGGKPTFGEDDKALLTDVRATVFERAPVVPLTFEIPLLEWRVGANRLLSDQPVRISGSGLSARGDALDADLEAGSFVLVRGGTIDLALPEDVRATLAATGPGPITVRKALIDGEERIELVASQGARLSASGEEPLQLDAAEIRMLARAGGEEKKQLELVSIDATGDVVAVSRGDTFRADAARFRVAASGRLEHADLEGSVSLASGEGSVRGHEAAFGFSPAGRPSSARVEGEVVIERGEDVFRAQAADFTFSPEGALSRATLSGDPTGSVAVGRFLPPDQRELRAAHAEISGPGPLVLEFAGKTKIELAGPGDLRVPEADLSIHAERSLSGEAEADHRSGRLVADGGVAVRWGSDDLTSERVELATSVSESGETVVDAKSLGLTTIHRTLEDGAVVSLTAEEGLETRSTGVKVVVSIARGVTISAEGPGAFRARADRVVDFDWEARSFIAEGNVTFESDRGSGTAERAVANGADDLRLDGSAGRTAKFSRRAGAGESRYEEASIEGVAIHATERALEASGEVRADLTAAEASYHLEGGEVEIEFGPPKEGRPEAARPFEARATSSVRAWVQTLRGESTLACDDLRIAGTTRGRSDANAAPEVVASDVRAQGSVVVDWSAQGGIAGQGDLFTLDPQKRGRLSAEPGKRVRAKGRLAPDERAYDLDADWIEFDEQRLEARSVEMRLEPASPESEDELLRGSRPPLLARLSADHLLATPSEILLDGNARAAGRTQQDEEWSIDAGSIRIAGKLAEKGGPSAEDLEIVQAWDGFDARLGIRGRALGKRLEGNQGGIRLEGEPAELRLGPIAMRSAWIEYGAENMLLRTDKGEIVPAEGTGSSWNIQYESLQPFDREDKTILALRNPVFRDGDTEMRALWTLFWVDRAEWRRSGRKALSESASGPDLRVEVPAEGPTPPGGKRVPPKTPEPGNDVARLAAAIARLKDDPLSKVLSEAYVEGNIELTQAGAGRARASALYLDFVEGHGWVREADFLEEVEIRGRDQRMRIRADWMRVSSNFSLRADKATLTFCGYDEPHYVVETGDLRLKLNQGGKIPWDVSATRNALRFENGWAIPLPPLIYAEDEEGNPIIENISLGQSAKFGASVGATFNLGLGKIGGGLGKMFEGMLSLPKASVRGHWSFHADFLGSRGVLLGTGLELKSAEKFKLNAEISAIPDRSEDKGLVRVPEDERSTLRDWFRARGRYTVSRQEWFDVALSLQSDPGVQSEFFEGDYLRYEQKDNFLHWRKASGSWYLSSSAKVLLEDRTDIEELPKAGVFRGRTPVGRPFGLEMLYTGYFDAAYLRRREGDPSFYPPFADFVDPLGVPGSYGDRDVARADTAHRFETPFPLGFAGLRATPWVEGRATVWDRGVDPADAPQRGAAIAGFDLGTTFWKRYGGEVLHTLSPFASVHADLASQESDGVPMPFDATEDPLDGRFVDVGLRSRVWNPASKARFDVEVRGTYAADLPDGARDEVRPIGVLSELLTWVGEVPVGVSHDGRYDVESGDTVYSRSFLGVRPHPKWDIELGYHRGLDADGLRLYEAASAATRYRATEKWEIELAETISVVDNRGLESSVTLRRIGHDFVTETEIGHTAGEGSRIGISLTPLLTWSPGRLGLLDRWLGR